MDSHDLSLFGSDLKACVLEATRTWYVHHEFSDCRCDTVCIWYKAEIFINYLQWTCITWKAISIPLSTLFSHTVQMMMGKGYS